MFKNGDIVQIISKVSKYKNAVGTVVGYCNGRYKDICRVKIWNNKIINIFDYNIVKFDI